MRVISFNTQAANAIKGRDGGKLRIDVRDSTLFIRPTDRKAGPHILTELSKGRGGLSVEISDKQAEKLKAGNLLEDNATFHLVEDKYGWFAMREGDAGEDAVEGSSATVHLTEDASEEVEA